MNTQLENSKPLHILRQAKVSFYEDEILGVHVSLEGKETVFVPVRPLCEKLGLRRYDQIVKIKDDEVLAEGSMELTLPSEGGNQVTFCLRHDLVPMWLTTIHASKVKPEYRDKIRLYRREVAKVLADYFLGTHLTDLQPSPQMGGFIREVVGSAVKSAIEEVSSGMIEQTVKTTMSAIRAEDPVYLVSKKLDVAERTNALTPLSEQERLHIKNFVMGTVFPGLGDKALNHEEKLTHAAEFLHEKSGHGYSWEYKTLEAAAAQLSKIAKQIWEEDGYNAFKESITIQSGRTVEAYIFPVKYAEKAFQVLVEKGKIKTST